jgi:hypothetical protein
LEIFAPKFVPSALPKETVKEKGRHREGMLDTNFSVPISAALSSISFTFRLNYYGGNVGSGEEAADCKMKPALSRLAHGTRISLPARHFLRKLKASGAVNNKADMKNLHFQQLCFAGIAIVLWTTSATVGAQEGHWQITQLPITNGFHPSINNQGEIVWNTGTASVMSSTRGTLSEIGIYPHLANNGEVVYADWFGGPNWDLVSTTRGRLTDNSNIDVNFSDFDLNASGEVVYVVKDTNNFAQVFSTVRNQLTFEPMDHFNPCINDLGEIIWTQYQEGVGAVIVSSVRGVISGLIPLLLDFNRAGEFCYSANIESPPGFYSFPHIASSAHGLIIDDPNQMQWGGSINDAGTIVWSAPSEPGSSTWYIYQAKWVASDTTPPQILNLTANPNILWPANHRLVPVKLTVNATDDSGGALKFRISKVSSNERVTGSAPDWQLTGALSLNLRAERSAKGKGRVYTVTVECQDPSGNVSSAAVQVRVPHDER